MLFLSNSPEQTLAFAAAFAPALRRGDLLALRGDLGAGKTVFVKGALAGLGFEGKVVSPTYTLAANYQIKDRDNVNNPNGSIYHFDAYLAAKESQFLSEGGAELFTSDHICFVEWPERIAAFLPAEYLEIELRDGGDGETRILQFNGVGRRGAELAAEAEILANAFLVKEFAKNSAAEVSA